MAKNQLHRLAMVHSDHIDRFTRVDAFSRIYNTAEIGHHCRIGNYCLIKHRVMIGNFVTIEDGVFISEGVTIKERAHIGSHVTFAHDPSADPSGRTPTLVREGARIGANATIRCGVTIGRYAQIAPGSAVTHDVPDFARVTPSPTYQEGWACSCGKALDLPLEGKGHVACSCGQAYALAGAKVGEYVPIPG